MHFENQSTRTGPGDPESVTLTMTLYEEFADDIEQAILSGVLRPGDRLPSIREASAQRRVSGSCGFASPWARRGRA